DGFDEISPDYEKVMTQLIRALKGTRVEQIWVTTRPHWREHLERELGTFVFKLKPLTRTEQVDFLTRFWQKRNPGFKDKTNEIRRYSEALIENLSKSISDQETRFTGIPLQTRMVAEVFDSETEQEMGLSEYLLNRNNSKQSIQNKRVNLVDLYEEFIRK